MNKTLNRIREKRESFISHPPSKALNFLLGLMDLEERENFKEFISFVYKERLHGKGRGAARIWFWSQFIRSLPRLVIKSIEGNIFMLINYLKSALRNLKRNKTFSSINLAGLVVGMSCFILIMLYVRYELSYDKYHENSDRIFRVAIKNLTSSYLGKDTWCGTYTALAPALMERFPEVEYATRFTSVNRLLLTGEKKNFYEKGLFADKQFFNVFSIKLLSGEKNRILDNLDTIILSQRLTQKFFGSVDPLGKILNCSLGDLEVVGIVENVPENSHIQFDWLIPFARQFSPEKRSERVNQWWNDGLCYTYCTLRHESDYSKFEGKLNTFLQEIDPEWKTKKRFFLQPIESIHLSSHGNFELSANNDIKFIRLFATIAVFILMIAFINSINLATAHASKRAKEIGIRKVVGSQKRQIFYQFCCEFVFISFMALLLAFVLARVVLSWFNQFVGRKIDLSLTGNWLVFLGLVAVFGFSGWLSAIYPALFLSSFQPVKILKGEINSKEKGGGLRNILVVFQFSITILLIISSIVIFSQMQFIKNKNIGYNREQIVGLRLTDSGIKENLPAFSNAVLQNPDIVGVSTSSGLLTYISSGGSSVMKSDYGEEIKSHHHWIAADYNFFDVFQMEIVEGRSFSEEYATDEKEAVIANEAFVNHLGWKYPIGKRIVLWGDEEKVVVGVVKDFHYQPLHLDIKPLIISCSPQSYIYFFYARLRPDNLPATLNFLKKVYDRFKLRYPFEYFFLDDEFNQLYRSEQDLGQMIVYFSGLAIFIACLGIFGLAMYTAQKKTKEIGIRKILGASVPGIVALLSRGYTKWVVLANVISWPIAYFLMNKWLQSYAYRIDFSVWIFILSGLAAFCIALITVSYQSIKAATANPVDSLRYE